MRATPAAVLLAALLACTAAAAAAAGPRRPLGKNGKQPNIVLLLTGEAGSTAVVMHVICWCSAAYLDAGVLCTGRPSIFSLLALSSPLARKSAPLHITRMF